MRLRFVVTCQSSNKDQCCYENYYLVTLVTQRQVCVLDHSAVVDRGDVGDDDVLNAALAVAVPAIIFLAGTVPRWRRRQVVKGQLSAVLAHKTRGAELLLRARSQLY